MDWLHNELNRHRKRGSRAAARTAPARRDDRECAPGVAAPFPFVELQQFLPLWANGGEADEDEGPRNKDVEALARVLGKDTTNQRPLLGWMQRHLGYDAYALALGVTKTLPLTAAMAHKKIVMQIALQAKSRGRTASARVSRPSR